MRVIFLCGELSSDAFVKSQLAFDGHAGQCCSASFAASGLRQMFPQQKKHLRTALPPGACEQGRDDGQQWPSGLPLLDPAVTGRNWSARLGEGAACDAEMCQSNVPTLPASQRPQHSQKQMEPVT